MDDTLEFNCKHALSVLIDEESLINEQFLPISKKPTKSFRRYYLETLINESPMRSGTSFKSPFSEWIYNTTEAKEYISGKKGKYIENFKYLSDVAIYENKYIDPDDGAVTDYILIIKNQEIIVGYTHILNRKNSTNKDIIVTHGLWNDRIIGKSLLFTFFINWLLPKYKLIISDNSTSALGENFWWKIIEYGLANNKKCGIYILEDPICKIKETIMPLSNKTMFNDAWDKLGSIKRIFISE